MISKENTTVNAQSPRAGMVLPVSRRSVLTVFASAIGISSITEVASATEQESSADLGESSKTSRLTVRVTDIEGEEEIPDVLLKGKKKRDQTDQLGKVVFEVENGLHEMIAEKPGYEEQTMSIEINGEDREIYLPLHPDTKIS